MPADLIMIQDPVSGLGIFKFKGKHLILDEAHDEIFQGFLAALQSMAAEMKIGRVTQISTTEHHFLVHDAGDQSAFPIVVIIMTDCGECVDYWKQKADQIALEFLRMYGQASFSGNVKYYTPFQDVLCKILELDKGACVWDF